MVALQGGEPHLGTEGLVDLAGTWMGKLTSPASLEGAPMAVPVRKMVWVGQLLLLQGTVYHRTYI